MINNEIYSVFTLVLQNKKKNKNYCIIIHKTHSNKIPISVVSFYLHLKAFFCLFDKTFNALNEKKRNQVS